MIETLLGSALGGLFRLAPEFMKWLDRKNERAHELAMFDKQIEADRLKAEAGQKLAELEAGKVIGAAEIQALIEATKAQSQLTGIKFVDAFNSLMRPTITFWWVIVLQTAVMATTFYLAIDAGKPLLDAIGLVWGPAEKAIVASIVSFWFVDRSLRKPQ